ncbi:FecR domain-containing protein [Aliamphritea spongicola]|nr:FecR domain-containing protein [Aliamphritea spongicola]
MDQLTPEAYGTTAVKPASDVVSLADIKQESHLKTEGKSAYVKRFVQGFALAACMALLAVLTPVHIWQPADYSTATAEQRIVELDDGSKLHLSAQSAVNVDYSSTGRHIELLYGEVFFEVASDPERPFRVRSENQTAQALGTAFNIRLLDDNIQTTLTEGTLKLDLDDQATLIINAGQRVEWDGTGKHRLLKGDYPYLPSWKRNIVRLDRMPLTDVVELLNRNYAPAFRIANPELRDQTLQEPCR